MDRLGAFHLQSQGIHLLEIVVVQGKPACPVAFRSDDRPHCGPVGFAVRARDCVSVKVPRCCLDLRLRQSLGQLFGRFGRTLCETPSKFGHGDEDEGIDVTRADRWIFAITNLGSPLNVEIHDDVASGFNVRDHLAFERSISATEYVGMLKEFTLLDFLHKFFIAEEVIVNSIHFVPTGARVVHDTV